MWLSKLLNLWSAVILLVIIFIASQSLLGASHELYGCHLIVDAKGDAQGWCPTDQKPDIPMNEWPVGSS